MVNKSINLSLVLGTYFNDQTEKSFFKSIHSDLNHLRIRKINDHPWKTHYKVGYSFDQYFATNSFLQFFKICSALCCQRLHVKLKELLKSWPKSHADLIEVKIKGSKLLFLEALLIFLIYRQNEENSKYVKRVADCIF
jgi:hypothetical protein